MGEFSVTPDSRSRLGSAWLVRMLLGGVSQWRGSGFYQMSVNVRVCPQWELHNMVITRLPATNPATNPATTPVTTKNVVLRELEVFFSPKPTTDEVKNE